MIDPADVNIYKPYIKFVEYAIERLKEEGRDIVMLDAGCGHTTVLNDQYKKCKQVIGVDNDRISLNKNSYVDRKLFSDLANIPLSDGTVDLIVSNWVFEHVSNPDDVVRDLDRVLRPGGYIVFITPNADGWYAALAQVIPEYLHGIIVRILYGRGKDDTYEVHYKMNTKEDFETYLSTLESDANYREVGFIYNDDPKYIGFNILIRPIAHVWHKLVMRKSFEKLRVHIIGLYKKND